MKLHKQTYFWMLSIAIVSVSSALLAYLGIMPKWMVIVLILLQIGLFILYVMLSNHVVESREIDWDSVEKAILKDHERRVSAEEMNYYFEIVNRKFLDEIKKKQDDIAE